MIKIVSVDELAFLEDLPKVYDYVSRLFHSLLTQYAEYCADCSISQFGAIYYLDNLSDFEILAQTELPQLYDEKSFEWEKDFDKYRVVCIVTDDIYAVNLIFQQELYKSWTVKRGDK